jgi:hypothetical protein
MAKSLTTMTCGSEASTCHESQYALFAETKAIDWRTQTSIETNTTRYFEQSGTCRVVYFGIQSLLAALAKVTRK